MVDGWGDFRAVTVVVDVVAVEGREKRLQRLAMMIPEWVIIILAFESSPRGTGSTGMGFFDLFVLSQNWALDGLSSSERPLADSDKLTPFV